jgi:hypothetical protein
VRRGEEEGGREGERERERERETLTRKKNIFSSPY